MATAKVEPKIYIVTNTSTGEARLIEATTKTTAVAFASVGLFTAERAGQRQLVEAIKAGATVESALKPSIEEAAFNEAVAERGDEA